MLTAITWGSEPLRLNKKKGWWTIEVPEFQEIHLIAKYGKVITEIFHGPKDLLTVHPCYERKHIRLVHVERI